jgi:hypothetical protein
MMHPNNILLSDDFTIGADPEMFLTKDGVYVAVQPYVDGTKDKPQPLPMGGNAQRDNVAIEFGVKPAASKLSFIQNIGDTLIDLQNLLPEGVELDVVPSANFPRKELKHKECTLFGCDADYNAWTLQINEPPKDAAKGTFRSCGGHVHLGYVPKSKYDFLKDPDSKPIVIQVLDCTLGYASTVLDNSKAAVERRILYGKAGCYRPTEYGVEYRTLSNYWIKSPDLVNMVYSMCADSLKVIANLEHRDLIMGLGGPAEIQRVINEGDSEAAQASLIEVVVEFLSRETWESFMNAFELLSGDVNVNKEWEGV